MDSGCTHMGIDKQLVKEEKIKMEPMDRLFEVFNADRTKNGEVTQFASLEVEINRHKEQINVAVIDLNGIDIFLGYDWLVKYNPEVNWNTGTVWFTRCSKTCKTQHQNIYFISRNRKVQPMDKQDNGQQEIEKKPDSTNLEDLPEYIWPFTHLFNKKKFKKLPDWQEWNYKINLTKEAPK